VRAARFRRLAERAAIELEDASAGDILGWAVEQFGDRLAVTASMSDTVLAHLASQVRPGIRVVFLDTGYHFPETLGTRDAVGAMYDVDLVTVRPRLSVEQQDARYGPALYERDPDRCCAMRKVAPLEDALRGYHAWATGIRREESSTRADTPVVAFDERRGMVKVAPLARWTENDVSDYAARHGLVIHPLTQLGYKSVGCAPCTRAVAPGEHSRSGRWAGLEKTECGIHA
jgi:phosphoadenosine phosphosulfate reductase